MKGVLGKRYLTVASKGKIRRELGGGRSRKGRSEIFRALSLVNTGLEWVS
jgi:hypothetical protein